MKKYFIALILSLSASVAQAQWFNYNTQPTQEQIDNYISELCKIETFDFKDEYTCKWHCTQNIGTVSRLQNNQANNALNNPATLQNMCVKKSAVLKKNIKWKCHLSAVVDCAKNSIKVNSNTAKATEKIIEAEQKKNVPARDNTNVKLPQVPNTQKTN